MSTLISPVHDKRSTLRMNFNENPYGPSPRACAALSAASGYANRYPDELETDLSHALAAELQVDPENIVTGNGATEMVRLISQALLHPGDEVVICEPTFAAYESEALLRGATVKRIPLDKAFCVDKHAVLSALTSHTRLVWLCSPNNPTGTLCDFSILRDLLESGVVVAVDEAYFPFGEQSALPHLQADLQSDLIVVRSMSKIPGLAGLRLGYSASSPRLATLIGAHRLPFCVNGLAAVAALATLSDTAWVTHIKQVIEYNREQLASRLSTIEGLYVGPSVTNFLLVEHRQVAASELFQQLVARNIFVRHFPTDRLHNFLRITVGLPEENAALASALAEACADLHRRVV